MGLAETGAKWRMNERLRLQASCRLLQTCVLQRPVRNDYCVRAPLLRTADVNAL